MIAKYYTEGEAPFPYSTPDSPSEPPPATEHLHGFEANNRDSDCDKDNIDEEEDVDNREEGGIDEISDEDGRVDNDKSDVIGPSVIKDTAKEIEVSNCDQTSPVPPLTSTSTSPSTSTSTYEEHVYTSLPFEISTRYPATPHPIGAYTKKAEDISSIDLQSLLLPPNVLSACWAARRLSIVGKHCKRSYCFTHSYGRLYDKSSGSVLWEVSVHFFYLPFVLAFSALITNPNPYFCFVLFYFILSCMILFYAYNVCLFSLAFLTPHTINSVPYYYFTFPSICFDGIMLIRMPKDH